MILIYTMFALIYNNFLKYMIFRSIFYRLNESFNNYIH